MFRYPGGKSKLKKEIIKNILKRNSYTTYCEPFVGAGSIFLSLLNNNTNFKSFIINDIDYGIYSFWYSVFNNTSELKNKILNYKPSVEDFFKFKKELLNLHNVERLDKLDIGFKKLVIHQISYSGLGTKAGSPIGGLKQKSNYSIDCRWSPQYLCNKINKYTQNKYTVDIRCTQLNFDNIINNSYDSFIYLDPPYYNKGNQLYQYGLDINSHHLLSDILKNTPNQWLLSYDDCKEIREIYKWANIQVLNINYTINTSRNKKELLIWK